MRLKAASVASSVTDSFSFNCWHD